MTCPGGCINGGGQPIGANDKDIIARMKSLYDIDNNETLKVSHKNPEIVEIYEKYFENPLSDKSHHWLHTIYQQRDVLL